MARGVLPTSARAWVLVGICLGAQLSVLGFTGIAAALPRPTSAWFSFPDGNGSGVVEFSPAPAWGGFHLTIEAVEGPTCGNPGGGCPVSYSIVDCLDRACDRTGAFVEAGGVEANQGTVVLAALTSSTIFLVTAYDGSHHPFSVRVGTSWSGGGHGLYLASGGSDLVLVFVGTSLVGLALLAVSLGARVRMGRART